MTSRPSVNVSRDMQHYSAVRKLSEVSAKTRKQEDNDKQEASTHGQASFAVKSESRVRFGSLQRHSDTVLMKGEAGSGSQGGSGAAWKSDISLHAGEDKFSNVTNVVGTSDSGPTLTSTNPTDPILGESRRTSRRSWSKDIVGAKETFVDRHIYGDPVNKYTSKENKERGAKNKWRARGSRDQYETGPDQIDMAMKSRNGDMASQASYDYESGRHPGMKEKEMMHADWERRYEDLKRRERKIDESDQRHFNCMPCRAAEYRSKHFMAGEQGISRNWSTYSCDYTQLPRRAPPDYRFDTKRRHEAERVAMDEYRKLEGSKAKREFFCEIEGGDADCNCNKDARCRNEKNPPIVIRPTSHWSIQRSKTLENRNRIAAKKYEEERKTCQTDNSELENKRRTAPSPYVGDNPRKPYILTSIDRDHGNILWRTHNNTFTFSGGKRVFPDKAPRPTAMPPPPGHAQLFPEPHGNGWCGWQQTSFNRRSQPIRTNRAWDQTTFGFRSLH